MPLLLNDTALAFTATAFKTIAAKSGVGMEWGVPPAGGAGADAGAALLRMLNTQPGNAPPHTVRDRSLRNVR
jgi:hypothetical protein